MTRIHISGDPSGRIAVSFPYDTLLIATAKTIPGHTWHPVEKYWSFPNTDGTLERILEAFHGREIYIDSPVQDTVRGLRTKNDDVVEFVPSPPPPESIISHPGGGSVGDLQK